MPAPVRDVLLDDDGNRVLVGNDYGFASGKQAVKQGIACRVRFWYRECWLDEARGVRYQDRILIRNANPLVVQAEIARAIAAQPDVTSVQLLTYSGPDRDRHASVSYRASTAEGTVAETVEVGV